jgi:uncharacterized phage protein (TIGR02216 family)
MAAGLGRLRLSPQDFWAMTLAELTAMLGGPQRPALARSDFAALMAAWPDAADPSPDGDEHGQG